MDLKPFIKKNVNPGEPVTAQGWNDVVDAVDQLYQYAAASRHTIRVKITTPGIDLESVRVTASRADGSIFEAVRPVAPGVEHRLSGLDPGAYTLTAELAGYNNATAAVTVGDTAETEIEMAPVKAGNFMPDLFGGTLAAARQALGDAGIPIVRLLDFNGRDLPPTQPDPQNDIAPVLVQWPPPDSAVQPGAGARLVIAVPVQIEPAVAVPSLLSLTQAEARKALESVGLAIGKVTLSQKAS
jgi:hypothetical protein